ncbi:MmgE/PrpD family protein [Siccirubricoccus sp. G192]|nr:MmgE/PrpD family protein [Siccirubricoccus sp. G192]
MDATAQPLLPHATRNLARFAAALRFEDLPAPAVAQAKLCLLDGIGVCLHGARLPWTRHIQAMVLEEGATPAASFWGTGQRGSLAQAVLVNGSAGHGFEMDDIHKESVLHPIRSPRQSRSASRKPRAGCRGGICSPPSSPAMRSARASAMRQPPRCS